jgi:membrane-associated phospholipid phosphatase
MQNAHDPDSVLPLRVRALVLFVVGGTALVSYSLVARLTHGRSMDLHTRLDDAIPFLPWTIWLYLPLYYLFFVVAAFAIRTRGVYVRAAISVVIASVVAYAIFFVMPSTYPRPEWASDGTVTSALLRFVRGADLPNNTFPSLHVTMTTAIVLACARESRARALVLAAIGVFPTLATLTTKQHWVVDIPGGLVLAALAHLMAFRARVPAEASVSSVGEESR